MGAVRVRPGEARRAKPANLTFEQAATLPLAAGTALDCVAGVQPGQKVLVNGASGGVGTFSVQLAKALGAEVTGVCSGRNVELVRGVGADHVIDYERSDFTSNGTRYDLIIDLVGNRSLAAYRRALTPHGTLHLSGGGGGRVIGPMARLVQALVVNLFVGQHLKPVFATASRAKLDRLRELAEAGSLTPGDRADLPSERRPGGAAPPNGRARPGQDRPHRRAGELMSYEERNVWVSSSSPCSPTRRTSWSC